MSISKSRGATDAAQLMRILTYKRTHVGDPDNEGRFGIYDCMGRIRNLDFDAVIGVGGIGQEPSSFQIDRKLTWVGAKPRKARHPHGTGVVVTFGRFRLMEECGPLLRDLAPSLAHRLYEKGARFLLRGYSVNEQAEAEYILEWAFRQPPIPHSRFDGEGHKRGCKGRCHRAVGDARGTDVG